MKKQLILLQLFFLFSLVAKSQNLDFTAPDTVCVGQSFQIQNTTNANSHLWTICSQNNILLPEGTVIANPNNALERPNYIHIEKEGTDYVGFVTNDKEVSLGYITRLNFGNSIKNIPTATNLGNFGGLLNHPAGLTLIKNGNNWHAFLLNSGQSASQYRIVRLDFGTSLNNTPTAVNLGNSVFFDYPFEISIHKEGNSFIGFFEDLSDNLFRINFGTNITNASPTITNLGNVGGFSRSFKHVVITENNKWYMLLVSDDVGGGGSVSKLSFGNSLLNIPTGQDLGSLGGLLKRPGSIVGERICDHWAFYITSLTGVNTIKMDFKNGMEQSSVNKNLGNVNGSSVSGGNSNLIIENNEKYVFYVNTIANNLTRTAFPKCNDIGIGPFSIQTPPLITINDTGTFFINYYINQGQITENSICKPIVVIEGSSINLGNDTIYCGDFSRVLSTGIPNTLWSTGQIGASITVNKAGKYWAQITNRCGIVQDTIAISENCNSCNSWLFTQANPSSVKVGDLDIVGNKITVECVFNALPTSAAHLVTKHTGMEDINYALSVNGAEIKTANDGYVRLDVACETSFNETYHVAMVYDGASLKFYRDGYLLRQIPCSGNLRNNNIITTIGNVDEGNGNFPNEQFVGYINEVRIWNKVRTQSEIRQYMNATLPNPTTQVGLKGYYVFNDLINKQGNAAFNGTLSGSAIINQTNPQCGFVPDSCIQVCEPTIRGDLNICEGENTILSVFGIFDSVRWSNNDTTRSIIVTQPGQYSVITYLGTCIGTDTVDVIEIIVLKPIISGNSEYCIGDSTLLTVNGIYDSVKWNNGTLGNEITVSSAGDYIAIAYLNGCSASDTINITVLTLPTPINIGNDTVLCDDFPKILSTGNAGTIWSTGQIGESISISQEGTYWAEITETCGFVRDSITLAFENCDCNIFVPNTFSPNNDKENDIFYPRTECPIKNIVFRVFNRWGEKVFESNDLNFGWDGTFKGKDAIVDSYSFTLNYNIVRDGSAKFLKGKIVLIR
jgi:gliding motility-associated-like protein